MPLRSNKLDVRIVKGDPFLLDFTLTDESKSLRCPIFAVDVFNSRFQIIGDFSAIFFANRLFRLSYNNLFQANKIYSVSAVSYSAGTDITTITIIENSSNNITAVSVIDKTFTVTGDLRRVYPVGLDFLVTGNANAPTNQQYRVMNTYYNGTSTIITPVQGIPSGASVSGALLSPAMPLGIAPSGSISPMESIGINITSYTIESDIKQSEGNSIVDSFTVQKTDSVNGKFTISLTGTETGLLGEGEYIFDVKLTPSSGNVLRIPDDGPGGIVVTYGVTN